ncbi:MAG: alcohol dehydrogenase catalytic domain-containing protein [Pseudomonadota bacterium]|nr:alcohol dehydrogenase catalytic domain-containing protein [Pseudomonadota bacterium]
MKALVYTAPGTMTYREEPDPIAQPGEVVIDVEAVGICGSDMHAYHGHDPRRVPPLILGHELAGTILGGGAAGRRVTVNPLITCGHCEYCSTGRDNLCAHRTMIGMTRAGGFAQRLAIPEASVIEIPPAMDARAAALTEPAATGLHALRLAMHALARPLPELRALVLGAGAVGLLAALLIRAYGCRDVAVGEVNALRRASAARAGAADLRVFDPAAEQSMPGQVDLVIDAVGSKATRSASLSAVKPGGVVVHIGLAEWSSEIDMRKLTLAEVTLIGTYTYTMADLRATVRALQAGIYGTLDWVEERPLSEGAAAFADLHAGRSGAAKIVLRPAWAA